MYPGSGPASFVDQSWAGYPEQIDPSLPPEEQRRLMDERQQKAMQMLEHGLANWRGSPGQLGFTEHQKELLRAL